MTDLVPAHSESAAPPRLWRYGFAGLVVLAAAAAWHNFPGLSTGATLWAESGNTAAALVEGRGFSDPFLGNTGPTAWIAPAFVWVEAGVFLIAGIKTAAAARMLLVLAVAGLAAAHVLIVACASSTQVWQRRAASVWFLGLTATLPTSPLHVLSESWLVVLLSAALVWAAREHLRAPRPAVTATLIAVAAIAALAHAGLALASACVLAALAILDRRARRFHRAPYWAAAVAGLALGGWTARNFSVFGRFVPLKSNFWFEMHLANIDVTTGVPRTDTVLRRMPFFSPVEFDHYARSGEIRYVEGFRAPVLAGLRREPAVFPRRVVQRIFNATVFCRQADGAAETRAPFSAMDRARLTAAGQLIPIAGTRVGLWTRIDFPAAEIRSQLASLQLDDFPGVWRDWVEKRLAYDARIRALLPFGFFIAAAPVIALCGALLAGRGRLSPTGSWSALVLAATVLPFVLVNHSQRHQVPLLATQSLLVGVCAQAWADRLRGRFARLPADDPRDSSRQIRQPE